MSENEAKKRFMSEPLALFWKFSVALAFLSMPYAMKAGVQSGQTATSVNQVQQAVSIKGRVVDTKGETLIGASIVLQGGKVATVTDENGNFTIKAPMSSKLYVNFLGYKSKVVTVNAIQLNITLENDETMLNELVVVGYGSQKKATLSGSVSQVRGDQVLAHKATNNIISALQGEIPGLTITRTSSRPGNEGTAITLRGGISVNNTGGPMIVIDGVEASQAELARLNPTDIETFSVLKDASASIFGTRAADGVILVTTKRGKAENVRVNYSGSSHLNILGRRFPVANGQQWAQMSVEANRQDSVASGSGNNYWLFTKDEYLKLANNEKIWRSDNKLYLDPTSDQYAAVYGNTNGITHNLSISGGNENLQVRSSFGYASDRSLVDIVYDGAKKYNFRTNVDYKVNKWILAELNTSYDKQIIQTPTQGVGQGIQDMFIFPLYNEKGQFYDAFGSNNLLAKLVEGGTTTTTNDVFKLGGKVTLNLGVIKPLKGLSLIANANIKEIKFWNVQRQTTVTMYDWNGELGKTNNIFFQTAPADRWVKDTYSNLTNETYGLLLNYDRTFGKHHGNVLGGVTVENNNYVDLYGNRSYMVSDELDAIKTGDAAYDNNSGAAWGHSLVSYLGRVNYEYDEIYLLQAQFRRDGSSKLAPEFRWKNFAGASAGIRISEMNIVKDLNIFNNLKARFSYGEMGAVGDLGRYDYISGITTGSTVFGTTPAQTQFAFVSNMTSRNRTWERIVATNYALDFAVLSNRLSGTIEYFVRENNGMLISVTYPAILGATAPKTNSGNFVAKGFDFSLTWNDKIGEDFRYNIGVSLSDSRTEVTKYTGAVTLAPGRNSVVEGKPINSLYVYRTDGYLQNETAVQDYYTANSGTGSLVPVNNTTNRLIPGCVNKLDLNDDGAITTKDLDYYADANPHYLFGINLGASYKSFDFSAFLQGVGQQYLRRENQMSAPFITGYTNQNSIFLGDTWTAENTNARYPVMSRNGSRNNWNYAFVNDINIMNVSYMRAKSIVLGYSLPKNLIAKAGLEKLRCWVSGDNLFEFDNVEDGFDPESKPATSQGNVDVFAQTVSLGVDITF